MVSPHKALSHAETSTCMLPGHFRGAQRRPRRDGEAVGAHAWLAPPAAVHCSLMCETRRARRAGGQRGVVRLQPARERERAADGCCRGRVAGQVRGDAVSRARRRRARGCRRAASPLARVCRCAFEGRGVTGFGGRSAAMCWVRGAAAAALQPARVTGAPGVCEHSVSAPAACVAAGSAGPAAPALVYASLDRIWTPPAGGALVPGRTQGSLGAKALLDGLWQRCAPACARGARAGGGAGSMLHLAPRLRVLAAHAWQRAGGSRHVCRAWWPAQRAALGDARPGAPRRLGTSVDWAVALHAYGDPLTSNWRAAAPFQGATLADAPRVIAYQRAKLAEARAAAGANGTGARPRAGPARRAHA